MVCHMVLTVNGPRSIGYGLTFVTDATTLEPATISIMVVAGLKFATAGTASQLLLPT